MENISCEIGGVVIRRMSKNIDNRGWLMELFRADELPQGFRPVMSYISMTKPGVARGPHEHREQNDYLCFIGSSKFRIYLWDNRPNSPTYRDEWRFEAGTEDMVAIFVPRGIVHAYKNIGDTAGMVLNVPDRLYAGEGRKEPIDEIRYEERGDNLFTVAD